MNMGGSKKIKVHSNQKQKFTKQQSHSQKKVIHKKQIEKTLNELYHLQQKISKLNVPQNPHSSSPVLKQIKNLSLLYETMTSTTYQSIKEPKKKNNLNIQLSDIKSAFKIINSQTQETTNQKGKQNKKNQISLFQNIKQVEYEKDTNTDEISSDSLRELIKKVYHMDDVDLLLIIAEGNSQKHMPITADEVYQFLNFNHQLDNNFDPLKQAYNTLLDDTGKFSPQKYNEINQIIGLPLLQHFEKLHEAFGLKEQEEITFQKFKQIIENGKDFI